jgi:hypothetical protein
MSMETRFTLTYRFLSASYEAVTVTLACSEGAIECGIDVVSSIIAVQMSSFGFRCHLD